MWKFLRAGTFLVRYWIWSRQQDFSLTWDKEGTGHYSGRRATAYFEATEMEPDESGQLLYSIRLIGASLKNVNGAEFAVEVLPGEMRDEVFNDIRQFYALSGSDAKLED